MVTSYRGRADYLVEGDWNASCYECGRKRKASELVRHWQGYYICREHWEPRHPQDFVRGVPADTTPPWTQPASDTFTTVCCRENVSAVIGLAKAGCSIVGYNPPL